LKKALSGLLECGFLGEEEGFLPEDLLFDGDARGVSVGSRIGPSSGSFDSGGAGMNAALVRDAESGGQGFKAAEVRPCGESVGVFFFEGESAVLAQEFGDNEAFVVVGLEFEATVDPHAFAFEKLPREDGRWAILGFFFLECADRAVISEAVGLFDGGGLKERPKIDAAEFYTVDVKRRGRRCRSERMHRQIGGLIDGMRRGSGGSIVRLHGEAPMVWEWPLKHAVF